MHFVEGGFCYWTSTGFGIQTRTAKYPHGIPGKQVSGSVQRGISTKPINIVLSKPALAELERKANTMGMKRNELIRQILFGIAFKETLSALEDEKKALVATA